eukprot:7378346-Prymnesium_polylepis.3
MGTVSVAGVFAQCAGLVPTGCSGGPARHLPPEAPRHCAVIHGYDAQHAHKEGREDRRRDLCGAQSAVTTHGVPRAAGERWVCAGTTAREGVRRESARACRSRRT